MTPDDRPYPGRQSGSDRAESALCGLGLIELIVEISLPRMFPILTAWGLKERIAELKAADAVFAVVGIPWDLIEPHERQAQANHSQTLTRLAERGGLSPDEALAVLEDRDYYATRRMTYAEANAALAAWLLANMTTSAQ